MKSAAIAEREQADLRRRSDKLALEVALGWEPIPALPEPEVKAAPTDAELRGPPRRSASASRRRATERQRGSAPGSIRPPYNSSRI